MANIAGVFRNSNGEWLLGFSSKVFSPNPLEAELQALLLGLNVVIQHCSTPLQINMDCLPIVQALSNVSSDDSPLMSDCRCLMLKLGNSLLEHVYKEQNKLAHALARMNATTTM
ncbi:hypothetical protein P3S67_010546 [Capsicum chacoense]